MSRGEPANCFKVCMLRPLVGSPSFLVLWEGGPQDFDVEVEPRQVQCVRVGLVVEDCGA